MLKELRLQMLKDADGQSQTNPSWNKEGKVSYIFYFCFSFY